MITYVALLRGINVGGHKKIPMVELRNLFSKHGYKNVMTYIQSGNVIFQSTEITISDLKNNIEEVIKTYFGFDVPVLIMPYSKLKTIFNECPLPKEKKENSYFMFVYSEPKVSAINEIGGLTGKNEEFYITKNAIYFCSAKGYGETKFNNNFFEKKLDITATARNYKTVLKLLSLCKDLN